MIELMISDNEMREFLIKNGWIVYEDIDLAMESIHGSKINYDTQKVWKAKKDDFELNLYHAFEKELKNKILQL